MILQSNNNSESSSTKTISKINSNVPPNINKWKIGLRNIDNNMNLSPKLKHTTNTYVITKHTPDNIELFRNSHINIKENNSNIESDNTSKLKENIKIETSRSLSPIQFSSDSILINKQIRHEISLKELPIIIFISIDVLKKLIHLTNGEICKKGKHLKKEYYNYGSFELCLKREDVEHNHISLDWFMNLICSLTLIDTYLKNTMFILIDHNKAKKSETMHINALNVINKLNKKLNEHPRVSKIIMNRNLNQISNSNNFDLYNSSSCFQPYISNKTDKCQLNTPCSIKTPRDSLFHLERDNSLKRKLEHIQSLIKSNASYEGLPLELNKDGSVCIYQSELEWIELNNINSTYINWVSIQYAYKIKKGTLSNNPGHISNNYNNRNGYPFNTSSKFFKELKQHAITLNQNNIDSKDIEGKVMSILKRKKHIDSNSIKVDIPYNLSNLQQGFREHKILALNDINGEDKLVGIVKSFNTYKQYGYIKHNKTSIFVHEKHVIHQSSNIKKKRKLKKDDVVSFRLENQTQGHRLSAIDVVVLNKIPT